MQALSTLIADVPGVGRPAAGALAEHGLRTVGDLAGRDWTELQQLHGVGPAAGRRLQAVLAEHGASLVHPPAPQTRGTVLTKGATGTVAKDIVTHATQVDPAQYVAGLDARRSREGAQLLEMFDEVTGERATMWGPSMIGYGEVHYRYATGREGGHLPDRVQPPQSRARPLRAAGPSALRGAAGQAREASHRRGLRVGALPRRDRHRGARRARRPRLGAGPGELSTGAVGDGPLIPRAARASGRYRDLLCSGEPTDRADVPGLSGSL